MMRGTFRKGLTLGLLAGLVLALVKILQSRSEPEPVSTWTPPEPAPRPDPAPRSPTAPAAAPEPEPWIESAGDGSCPDSHPVKAKMNSKIFHLPGMMNYDRTNPDRCYCDEAAAEADGLRKAKR